MDIRQLKYFLVLCEELNYTRAAKRLYLTRQALRQSMDALQSELGEALLTNRHNHLALTERGQWLQSRAKPVVESFSALEREIFETAAPAGPLRLGVSVALVPDYLPELPLRLDQFRARHPNCGLEVSFLPNDEVLAAAEAGTLELGLIMDLESSVYAVPRLICRKNRLSLMAPREHRLWAHTEASVQDLRGERLSLPGRRAEPFAALKTACRAAGFELDVAEAPSFYQACYLVRNEGCLSITCEENAEQSRFDPVRVLPLTGMPPLCVSLLRPLRSQSVQFELLWEEVLSKI